MTTDTRAEPRSGARSGLVWRGALPVAAVAALLADVPPGVAGGLALAGAAGAVEALARRRGLGLVDGVAVGVGGLLAVLVLVGLLLGSTGLGLTPSSWVLGLAVASLGGVLIAAVLPSRPGAAPAVDLGPSGGDADGRRQLTALLPWVALAVGAVVLAVRLSAGSVAEVDPLAMSVGRVDGTRVEVVLTSGETTGPLEVRTAVGGNEVSYPLVSVEGRDEATATVSLPTTGRSVITLSRPGETESLRTLVLDR